MAKIVGYLSPSRLSSVLAALIIFLGSTQLGLHFWPSSALVYGIRIDYLSPTLYFLDLLIILFFVIRRSDLVGCKSDQKPMRSDLMGTLAPLLLANLLYSQNPLATLSWSLHFVLYLSFALSLRTVLVGSLRFIFTLTLLFQTILAAAQVFLGHSVSSFMYYLGERSVSVGSPGIALATFMDRVVLRGYGTFSHPNILAGYAVIVLLIILRLVRLQLPKSAKSARPVGLTLKEVPNPAHTMVGEGQTQLVLLTTFLTTILILLTQSRSAALALFGIIIPFYLIKNLKYSLIYFAIILSMAYYLPSLVIPARSDLSSAGRLTLQTLSLSVIKNYPIFGAGAQSSISTYPRTDSSVRLLQPDHDSFTLLLSWFGIFGLLSVLHILRLKFENLRIYDLRFFAPILPILLLDHYLLTSPQGIFAILLYTSIVNLDHRSRPDNL